MCSFIRNTKCLFYLSSSFIMISAIRWEDRNISKLEFRRNLTQSQIVDYMDYSRIINLPSSETTSSDIVHEYSSITEEDFYLTKLKSGIVPDLVDKVGNNQYFNDCIAVEVNYHVEEICVTTGEILKPKEMLIEPIIDWYYREDQLYTAIMLDLDYPSRRRPSCREFVHWMLVNIPENKIEKAQNTIQYLRPIPGSGTGVHRLAVVLFEQPGQIVYRDDFLSIHQVDDRKHFSTVDFAKKYHLGHPIGGQWWLTEWDNTVEDFYKPDFL